jgi:hypothetical protein
MTADFDNIFTGIAGGRPMNHDHHLVYNPVVLDNLAKLLAMRLQS